jgi:Acetyltransferase (GNAT) domain
MTPFQTPAWRAAAVSTGRFVDATVAVERSGREVVLPALRPHGPSRRVSSLPLGWGFGGVVAPGGQPTGEDVAAAVSALGRSGARRGLLRPPPRQDLAFERSGVPWSRVRENHSFEIDLRPGWAAVSAAFTSSVRRAVRKAEKSGVVVERCTDRAAVAEFHRLYHVSVLRWAQKTRVPDRVMQLRAARAEPLAKYDAVLRHLGDDCGIWVARHSGVAVGALVVLSHGGEHAYWRGAMDLEKAGPVRANDLLQVSAIEHACRQGAERYAMGLTAPGSGLARFKAGFGAEPQVSHEYSIEPAWLARLREGAAPALEGLRGWASGRAGS